MQEIQLLLQALAQNVGNKVYLRDLEKMLKEKNLTPQEKQTLAFLARDIQQLGQKSKRGF